MKTVREPLLGGLHVLALWAVVVVQPLFDLLAKSPEFFVAHHAGRTEILLMAFGLAFVIPSALVAAVWLARFAGQRVRAWTLATVIGLLAAMLAAQALKRVGFATATSAVPTALALGLAAAVVYHRLSIARTFATVLSIAIVIVPATFLLQPPIRRALVAPADVADSLIVSPADILARRRMAPVVMLVLDEIPLVSLLDADGKIDPVLYPNFAALARDGTWFRNATTVSDFTRWALPSIVTGTRPVPDAAPTASDHPLSLFTLLARTHRVEGIEEVTRLCPDSVCGPPIDPIGTRLTAIFSDLWIIYLHTLLTDDLKANLPSLTGDWANFGAAGSARQRRRSEVRRRREEMRRWGSNRVRNRAQLLRRFIAGIDGDDPQPTLYFIHTMLSHSPHEFLPTGQINGTRTTTSVLELPRALPGKYRDAWTNDEWVVVQNYQRHLLQLGFVDLVIGELIDHLKDIGLYDRALVVVLADHGAVFLSGFPRRDYTDETAAAVMRVPLLMKFPVGAKPPAGTTLEIDGQHVNDRNVETVDILPTIADVLGIAMPRKIDGISLLEPTMRERPTKTLYSDFARRTHVFDRRGPDAGPALGRKIAIFGPSENRFRMPLPPSFSELIGQPLATLRVSDGTSTAEVDFLSDFLQMDTRRDSVAFDLAGRLAQRPPGNSPIYLAIAVNGTVRAVTRTWLAAPREWLATPPLDAWRDGRNLVEVFVLEATAQGAILERCRVRQGRDR